VKAVREAHAEAQKQAADVRKTEWRGGEVRLRESVLKLQGCLQRLIKFYSLPELRSWQDGLSKVSEGNLEDLIRWLDEPIPSALQAFDAFLPGHGFALLGELQEWHEKSAKRRQCKSRSATFLAIALTLVPLGVAGGAYWRFSASEESAGADQLRKKLNDGLKKKQDLFEKDVKTAAAALRSASRPLVCPAPERIASAIDEFTTSTEKAVAALSPAEERADASSADAEILAVEGALNDLLSASIESTYTVNEALTGALASRLVSVADQQASAKSGQATSEVTGNDKFVKALEAEMTRSNKAGKKADDAWQRMREDLRRGSKAKGDDSRWNAMLWFCAALVVTGFALLSWLVVQATFVSKAHLRASEEAENRAGLAQLARVRLILHGTDAANQSLDLIALPGRQHRNESDADGDDFS
jgi:hypothetical protein